MPIHVREEKTMKDKKESERRAGRGNEGGEHRNNGKTEEMRKVRKVNVTMKNTVVMVKLIEKQYLSNLNISYLCKCK